MASLQAAFGVCRGSAVVLLVTLFEKGEVVVSPGDAYTLQQFRNEWTRGGKAFLEQHWRDPANTASGHTTRTVEEVEGEVDADGEMETIRGKHEWIPTNMLAYVVENAFENKDLRWIYMAEVLRTATRDIVALPQGDFVYPANRRLPGDLGLTGHVGALYVRAPDTSYKARFKAQAKFHDVLRNILKTYLTGQLSDTLGYCSKLEEHITATYWQGDLTQLASLLGTNAQTLAAVPCPYYYLSGVNTYTKFGDTMGEMAEALRGSWATNHAVLQNVIKSIKHVS